MPSKTQGTSLNLQEVGLHEAAMIFNKAPTTLKAWFNKGCPVLERGHRNKRWRICPADIMAWREEQVAQQAVGDLSGLDMDEARLRKTAAEAALAELDLYKRRGEVIEIEDVAAVIADEYSSIRAKFLSMPSKLAPQLDGIEDPAERKGMIEAAIFEVLEELAADGIYSLDESEESDTQRPSRKSTAAA